MVEFVFGWFSVRRIRDRFWKTGVNRIIFEIFFNQPFQVFRYVRHGDAAEQTKPSAQKASGHRSVIIIPAILVLVALPIVIVIITIITIIIVPIVAVSGVVGADRIAVPVVILLI